MSKRQRLNSFILTQLEVFNWGPFGGRHCAEIDPQGSAIIGPTGSGKTTLVDALMTMLVARPKYNLASTGGHESDRDLISYIRGVTGTGNKTDNNHVARQGNTTTGISIRFSNGDQIIHIGAVFWIEGVSFAAKDQKDLWLCTDRDDQSLEQWLTTHQDGAARALKQHGRETTGLRVFDTKKSYLAQLRQRFEVGENAFALLNRAAGLKQINSIDEIFRELVLEDRAAFSRAFEVAHEFDDLSAIRSELELARKQEQSLIPIAQTYDKFLHNQTQLDLQRTLIAALPIWYAMAGHRGWSQKAQDLEEEIRQHQTQIDEQNEQAGNLQQRAHTLMDLYLKAGGASIEQLKEQIHVQEKLLKERKHTAHQYRLLTQRLGLNDALTRDALRHNQQQAQRLETVLKQQLEQEEIKQLETAGRLSAKLETEKQCQEEIKQIRQRPGSNIHSRYQQFRTDLADELDLEEEQLPFIAQLIEVKAQEKAWQGAIERAIGSNRLRILVPPTHIKEALKWVNNRDNRLHVRLLIAQDRQKPAQFMADGFTHKLNFKAHPYREILKSMLATIDRHCVDSPETLRNTPYSMTLQGLMSNRQGNYEKQDQTPLNKDWMTGFDNKQRLIQLDQELLDLSQARKELEVLHNEAKQKVKLTESKLNLLERLIDLAFETIDLPGVETLLQTLQQRLTLLTDPNSDVGKARQQLDEVEKQLGDVRQMFNLLNEQRAVAQKELEYANQNREIAFQRIGVGLNEEQLAQAQEHLTELSNTALEDLDQSERDERQTWEEQQESTRQKFTKLGKDLVRMMSQAQKIDTGALVEAGTDIGDIPTYLKRLEILTTEALPTKLKRFLEYLNQSSDQGVTQLLTDIENEASQIEERIHELNQTLQRVDFHPGQYLQLVPQRVVHESIATLHKAQRHLRSAALKDDQGESHYSALRQVVELLRDASERKNTVGAKALLDPRYRLQFAATIIDRQNQKQLGEFKGSQSGSGGEKEIIASYILTASLSYALCPPGTPLPLFGTIVLDEAFSKSSQAIAGRIILALREFGLHPLFITPNKEMRLLRNHTRSAILVHRKGIRASLTSLSWEELEEIAQEKRQRHEVA
jgi:uncharacterized protein YPO0396